MSIKVRYYYHDGGEHFKEGEVLTIRNHKIFLNTESKERPEHFEFFYDDTSMQIKTARRKGEVKRVIINRILTENKYRFGQNQYLVHMNWYQKQKLIWMFDRHWLQQPHNSIQLIIIFIIIALAGIGYNMIHSL